MKRRSFGGLLALWPLIGGAVSAAETRLFEPGSYRGILEGRSGRPLLLVFWSLDCPPCQGELAMLGRLRAARPELPLVLVSTDPASAAAEVERLLAERGLAGAESWIFAEGVEQRLRFEVDRHWYGELPRSYFFDADHRRHGVTGRLSEEQVNEWFTAIR